MSSNRISGQMPLSRRPCPSSGGRGPPSAPQRPVPTMASAANPKLTPLAIGRDLIAVRYPDWWTSARCGNLDRDTCVLLDFAHPLVTHGRIGLGSASGAGIQVRADPAGRPPTARTAYAAYAAYAAGAVRPRLATPAHSHYLRICRTSAEAGWPRPVAASAPGFIAHRHRLTIRTEYLFWNATGAPSRSTGPEIRRISRAASRPCRHRP